MFSVQSRYFLSSSYKSGKGHNVSSKNDSKLLQQKWHALILFWPTNNITTGKNYVYDDDMAILMCIQKLTNASLIYCTEPKTKTKWRKLKNKNGYTQKKRCWARNHRVSPERGKGSQGWKWFMEQEGFDPGVKQRQSDGWWQLSLIHIWRCRRRG